MQIKATGSQTAVISTKHQIYTTTAIGTYVLAVDTTNMALGDVLELYADIGVYSGDAHVQAYYVTYAHNQADLGKLSVPVVGPYGVTFHLKQTAGTGRAFKWSVVAL